MVKVINSLNELKECQENSTNKIFLLDFYADWCGPCRRLTPKLEELSEKFKDFVTILKVNVDNAEDITSEHNISCMPTLVFIVDGTVFSDLRIEGANEPKILENLNYCVDYIKENSSNLNLNQDDVSENMVEQEANQVQLEENLVEQETNQFELEENLVEQETNQEENLELQEKNLLKNNNLELQKLEIEKKINEEISKLEEEIKILLNKKTLLQQHMNNNK